MSYFEKSIHISIFDMIIIAVIGGLLVPLLRYLINKLIRVSIYFFNHYIVEPLSRRRKKKLYNKRLIDGNITSNEFVKLSEKVKNGTATDNEAKAVTIKEKERNEILNNLPELREELKKFGEGISEQNRSLNMEMLPNIKDQHKKLVQSLNEINKK